MPGKNEPPHDKIKMVCAPSEDSDHPGHPPSLIRVFAVRMKKHWVLSYPLSAQQRLWSDWADGFVTRQFKYFQKLRKLRVSIPLLSYHSPRHVIWNGAFERRRLHSSVPKTSSGFEIGPLKSEGCIASGWDNAFLLTHAILESFHHRLSILKASIINSIIIWIWME